MTLKAVKFVFICFSILLFSSNLLAQGKTGIVQGKLVDKETGEELIGAAVKLEGAGTYQALADFNGEYHLSNVQPGTYTLNVVYLGYANQVITGVVVKPGEITQLNASMAPESYDLKEVVIEAKAVKNNEVALLNLQKNAVSVQDGLSAQEMSRTGSSSAAESVSKVTGASVEGGKYMVVRGLGDRYSITQLNGITLPSTDPYRNSSSLDLIPSYMLDNIITAKTFTPDQPGNFTGGKMDISTKSFPDKFTLNFSTSATYNTQSSFNDQFLTYAGGKTDWLGYDDGTRAMPDLYKNTAVTNQMVLPQYIRARRDTQNAALFQKTANALNNDFLPVTTTVPIDHAMSFSFGNQHKLFGRKFGYVLGLNYSRSFTHYDNGTSGGYELTSQQATELNPFFTFNDTRSTDNPQVGGLLNLAYRLNTNNEISFNYMYNHDAEKTARYQYGSYPGALSNGSHDFYTRALLFKERTLHNAQLKGKHVMPGLQNTEIEWAAGRTRSTQEEPDLRFFANSVGEDTLFYLNKAEYDYPFHFFRELTDIQHEAKLDITVPLSNKPNANKIKFGGLFSNKGRNFDEYRFQVENQGSRGVSFAEAGGDFEEYFNSNNFGIIDTVLKPDGSLRAYETGNFIMNQSRLDNFYDGKEQIAAAYAMGIVSVTDELKLIGGARLENTDILVESQNPNAEQGIIKVLDLLPSINAIYALSEKTNIRAAYSKTLARPNMRELAPFASFDFIGGFIYLGNPKLQRTLIHNYDLRLETYPKSGEMFAISAYYKEFKDPIVKVFNPSASNPEIIFQNVGSASVYGTELEFRKVFLKNFKFGTNVSIIFSRVQISDEELKIARQLNPEFKTWRPFQGQSPYLVNTNLSYNNKKYNWESTVSFNVFGKRLSEVSLLGTPDIYETPRPTLNFVSKKMIKDHFQIGISASNLLNPYYQRGQFFNDQIFVVEKYKLGRSFGVSLGYMIK